MIERRFVCEAVKKKVKKPWHEPGKDDKFTATLRCIEECGGTLEVCTHDETEFREGARYNVLISLFRADDDETGNDGAVSGGNGDDTADD